jgi:peptide/nickel transport system substrate-binding protein
MIQVACRQPTTTPVRSGFPGQRRRRRRSYVERSVALLIAVSFSAGLTACGAGPQGRLIVLAQGDVDSLDPGVTNYQFGYMIEQATQRALYAYKPGGHGPAPDLAAGPSQISDGGKTVTVRLRGGVHFSPPVNREVTAADVKYAFERSFLPSVANGYAMTYFGRLLGVSEFRRGKRRQITGIETPNSRELVFRFTRPVGAVAAQAMVLPISAPVPPEYARRLDAGKTSRYGLHPVATGPYMVRMTAAGRLTGYLPGRRIILVRNPNWKRAGDFRPAHADEIDVREGFDPKIASRRILAGKDIVSGDFLIPPDLIKRHDGDARLELTPSGGIAYVALNTTLPPFDRLNVRRALAAALDRTAMRAVFGGRSMGAIATHFIPPATPGYEEAGGAVGPPLEFNRRPDGDLSLARRYLRDAGYRRGRYPGGRPLLMVASNDPVDGRIAEIVQAALHRLGIKTRLRLVSTEMLGRFCGAVPTEAAVCPSAGLLKDFNDPQTLLDAPFNGDTITSVGNLNISQFNDPQINAKIHSATQLIDPGARRMAWAEIDRLVTSAVPAIPWLWSNAVNIRSANVKATVNSSTARWDLASTSLK